MTLTQRLYQPKHRASRPVDSPSMAPRPSVVMIRANYDNWVDSVLSTRDAAERRVAELKAAGSTAWIA